MGDGPDWRQVDRARLLQVRAEERKKVTEEWLSWLEGEIREGMLTFASGPDLLDRFEGKVTELRARLVPPCPSEIPCDKGAGHEGFHGKEPSSPESKSTAMPETLPTPLAETKTTE